MKSEIQKVKRDCRNENRELKKKIYYLESTLKQMCQNQTFYCQKFTKLFENYVENGERRHNQEKTSYDFLYRNYCRAYEDLVDSNEKVVNLVRENDLLREDLNKVKYEYANLGVEHARLVDEMTENELQKNDPGNFVLN